MYLLLKQLTCIMATCLNCGNTDLIWTYDNDNRHVKLDPLSMTRHKCGNDNRITYLYQEVPAISKKREKYYESGEYDEELSEIYDDYMICAVHKNPLKDGKCVIPTCENKHYIKAYLYLKKPDKPTSKSVN